MSICMDTDSRQEAENTLRGLSRDLNVFSTSAKKMWSRIDERQRESLGGDLNTALLRHGNSVGIWMHLHQMNQICAILDLAEELEFLNTKKADWLRKELGELSRDPEMAQVEAIARGDLVIERISRTVYWNGELIQADWFKNNKSWEFLLITCEHALRNKPIDRFSFGNDPKFGIVSKSKYRLFVQVPEFPAELRAAFKFAGKGTQQFMIPREKLHFFD